MVVMLVLGGCRSDSADPPPATPQAEQPASPPNSPPPAAAPTVNAGPDQTVTVGQQAVIHGAANPADYQPICWQILQKPNGSQATLSVMDGLTAVLTPDLLGTYIIKLGCGLPLFPDLPASPSDTMQMTATALPATTLHFTGTFGPDGTASGTFTYEIGQGPNATNVRTLTPNVLYRLTSWNIVVSSGQVEDLLPSTVFDSSQPDNTAEFCEGICIFSSTPIAELRFRNRTPFMLQLAFEHADPTPFINPPGNIGEWGAHLQSTYRVPDDVPLAVFHTGVLTEAP
jgi:hypothetical protein